MGRHHKSPPGLCRQSPTSDVFHGGLIVVTHPDTGDQVGAVTDKPGIPEVLRGSGFAGERTIEVRRLPGSFFQRLGQHGVHGASVNGLDHPARSGPLATIQDASLAIQYFFDSVRPDTKTSIGESSIGGRHFDQADAADSKGQTGSGQKI